MELFIVYIFERKKLTSKLIDSSKIIDVHKAELNEFVLRNHPSIKLSKINFILNLYNANFN